MDVKPILKRSSSRPGRASARPTGPILQAYHLPSGVPFCLQAISRRDCMFSHGARESLRSNLSKARGFHGFPLCGQRKKLGTSWVIPREAGWSAACPRQGAAWHPAPSAASRPAWPYCCWAGLEQPDSGDLDRGDRKGRIDHLAGNLSAAASVDTATATRRAGSQLPPGSTYSNLTPRNVKISGAPQFDNISTRT